jgi:hypothetical protein
MKSTVSRCSLLPVIRMRVSMSSGRSSNALPSAAGTRFCHVSATASSGSKPPAKPMSSSPAPDCGRLPNSQADSRSEIGTPASPSNSSR